MKNGLKENYVEYPKDNWVQFFLFLLKCYWYMLTQSGDLII